mmetsp:Transcript_127558/g.271970  ORF Transcript_127558/g.271970 Transcript_127558/m.271970 type:complete len:211 (+) Transcript_127558:75-707(+)
MSGLAGAYTDGIITDESKEKAQLAGKVWSVCRAEKGADKKYLLKAIADNPMAIAAASDDLLKDKEVILAAVKQNGSLLKLAPPSLRADREVVMAAVRQRGWALSCASQKLQGDREVVMAALGNYGKALEFASAELRADQQVVDAAYKQDPASIAFKSDLLKSEPKEESRHLQAMDIHAPSEQIVRDRVRGAERQADLWPKWQTQQPFTMR